MVSLNIRHSDRQLLKETGSEGGGLAFALAFGERTHGLKALGMKNLGLVYSNLPVPKPIEHALAKGEGGLASNGALCVETGKYRGRSPHGNVIFWRSLL